MHLTRQSAPTSWPIPRKGTKYVATALSDRRTSVPVSIALRDILKLARTKKEVNEMIKKNLLEINGRKVHSVRESVKLFSILKAGQNYILTIDKHGKYMFDSVKDSSLRPCKVMGKRTVTGGKIQYSFHEGSNLISKEKINIHDTVFLTFDGKIKSQLKLENGRKVLIISGKRKGSRGKINDIEGKTLTLTLEDKEEPVAVDSSRAMAI